jgi:hypothetical protein
MDLETALAMLASPQDHDDADLRRAADCALASSDALTEAQTFQARRFQRFGLGKPKKENTNG